MQESKRLLKNALNRLGMIEDMSDEEYESILADDASLFKFVEDIFLENSQDLIKYMLFIALKEDR